MYIYGHNLLPLLLISFCRSLQQLVVQFWTHGPQPAQAGIARERLWFRRRREISGEGWLRASVLCVVCGWRYYFSKSSGLAGILHHGLTTHAHHAHRTTHPHTQNARPQTPTPHQFYAAGQTTNAPAQILPALAGGRGSRTGLRAARVFPGFKG